MRTLRWLVIPRLRQLCGVGSRRSHLLIYGLKPLRQAFGPLIACVGCVTIAWRLEWCVRLRFARWGHLFETTQQVRELIKSRTFGFRHPLSPAFSAKGYPSCAETEPSKFLEGNCVQALRRSPAHDFVSLSPDFAANLGVKVFRRLVASPF